MDATYLVNVRCSKRTLIPTRARRAGTRPDRSDDDWEEQFVLLRKPELPMQSIQICTALRMLIPRSWILPLRQISEPRQSYILDGFYCAQTQSYPLHFPNPLLTTRRAVLNTDWPSSSWLRKMVALDSVGLDILYSQTKNNLDKVITQIMIREKLTTICRRKRWLIIRIRHSV